MSDAPSSSSPFNHCTYTGREGGRETERVLCCLFYVTASSCICQIIAPEIYVWKLLHFSMLFWGEKCTFLGGENFVWMERMQMPHTVTVVFFSFSPIAISPRSRDALREGNRALYTHCSVASDDLLRTRDPPHSPRCGAGFACFLHWYPDIQIVRNWRNFISDVSSLQKGHFYPSLFPGNPVITN